MYRIIKASRDETYPGGWERLRTKSVPDSDGFNTDYTLYYNHVLDIYICMFGDRDIYGPDRDNADFETESEDEAYEWFDSYNGFEDDDIYSATEPRHAGYRNVKHMVENLPEGMLKILEVNDTSVLLLVNGKDEIEIEFQMYHGMTPCERIANFLECEYDYVCDLDLVR